MPPLGENKPGWAYWRSLNELTDTPEFRALVEQSLVREPLVRESLLAPPRAGVLSRVPTRRQFLQLMGASLGLAGLTGCRWPKDNIVPYAHRPDNRTPGITEQYATAMELGGVAQGLLVTSYDGRPIKVEGNPLHPMNRGATDVFAQASVLELYDPDRSKVVVRRADGHQFAHTWDDFVAFAKPHCADLRTRGGAGLCILSEATSSPSVIDMRGRLLKAFPQAKWYEYEPISRDNELAGATLAFGKPYRTHLRLDQAKVIVCLDADILGTHPAAINYARDFADSRTANPLGSGMSRLYAIESVYSITGGMADHRFAVRSQDIAVVLCRLAVELLKQGLPVPAEALALRPQLEKMSASALQTPYVAELARELLANRGRGVIAVGPRQPAGIHQVTHVLNIALGNVGQGVTYTQEPADDGVIREDSIASLAAEITAGKVATLLILGGNPAFDRAHGASRDSTIAMNRVCITTTSEITTPQQAGTSRAIR